MAAAWLVADGRAGGGATRLPLLSEMDPLDLRVHRAIQLPGDPAVGRPGGGVDPRLPSWVDRDLANEDVRPWLGRAVPFEPMDRQLIGERIAAQ